MARVVLLAVVLLSSAPAHAEPASAGVALGLSFATTVGSGVLLVAVEDNRDAPRALVAVGLAGVVLGPSAGHVYAGHTISRGLLARLAGLGVVALGIFAAPCPIDSHNRWCPSTPVIAAGGAVFVAGMVDDFITLPRAVRRLNERYQVSIAPAPRGLAIAGRF